MKANKRELKEKIISKVDELIDGVELIGNLNFFSINIKSVNGDLLVTLENTYKEKI